MLENRLKPYDKAQNLHNNKLHEKNFSSQK